MSRVLKGIIANINNEMICANKNRTGKPEDSGFVYGLAKAKDIVEEWLKVVEKK